MRARRERLGGFAQSLSTNGAGCRGIRAPLPITAFGVGRASSARKPAGNAPRGSERIIAMGRLDDLDLSLKLSRAEEAQRLTIAQARLLQLRLVMGGLTGPGKIGPPVLALFEGWDASGKGGAIKRLAGSLDPRHVRVAQFAAPTYDEKRHHFLWRFSSALPGWGGMAVLDRSWYGRVLVERVE